MLCSDSAVKGSGDVQACLEAVQATVCLSGWPSIPKAVLQVRMVFHLALGMKKSGSNFMCIYAMLDISLQGSY